MGGRDTGQATWQTAVCPRRPNLPTAHPALGRHGLLPHFERLVGVVRRTWACTYAGMELHHRHEQHRRDTGTAVIPGRRREAHFNGTAQPNPMHGGHAAPRGCVECAAFKSPNPQAASPRPELNNREARGGHPNLTRPADPTPAAGKCAGGEFHEGPLMSHPAAFRGNPMHWGTGTGPGPFHSTWL